VNDFDFDELPGTVFSRFFCQSRSVVMGGEERRETNDTFLMVSISQFTSSSSEMKTKTNFNTIEVFRSALLRL
jgi:hypothetical protein